MSIVLSYVIGRTPDCVILIKEHHARTSSNLQLRLKNQVQVLHNYNGSTVYVLFLDTNTFAG